jgi:leader peptidase (prepilin peptidase) / N-methyltransferase
MGQLSEAHLWAVLSAPICALFVARAAYAFEAIPVGAPPAKPDMAVSVFLALGVAFAAFVAPSAIEAAARIVFLCGLAHLALIDLRLMVTPVRASLALAAAGIVHAWLVSGAKAALVCAVAAAAGWLAFRALDLAYLRWRGRSGLGEGDALIAAALGGWLSFEGLAWSVAAGGALTLLVVAFVRRDAAQPFPFAPGLALGAFVVVVLRQ